MDVQRYTLVASPIGELLLLGDHDGLHRIEFQDGPHPCVAEPEWMRDDTFFAEAADQLRAYFAGELQNFALPLVPDGTDFQQQVWRELRRIPYGRTISYGELARRIGKPSASRAVGAANGRNPLPIIVPCHRVIGSNGSLTGFAGGLAIKEALLALETSARQPSLVWEPAP